MAQGDGVRVRVLVAPDKFAGTLSAGEAGQIMADAWRAAVPGADLDVCPLSDGGPGLVDVLGSALDGQLQPALVRDPLGRQVPAAVLLTAESAVVESAQAVGLHLLTPTERDPERTTSAGLADLLLAAARSGRRELVVGLGGSATVDGGRGLIEAWGGPTRARRMLPEHGVRRLVVLVDVDNPLLGLTGAAAVFGPQKGASREAVFRLERRMTDWADELRLGELANRPGAGAAGGLGAALLWLGGDELDVELRPGVATVAERVLLADRAADADLVVTGEGRFDATSLRGKVVSGVAAAAQAAGVPCLVIAGQVAVGRREMAAHGIDAAYSLVDQAGSTDEAMTATNRWLAAATTQAAREWCRPP